jgi:hypothetical protein
MYFYDVTDMRTLLCSAAELDRCQRLLADFGRTGVPAPPARLPLVPVSGGLAGPPVPPAQDLFFTGQPNFFLLLKKYSQKTILILDSKRPN